MTKITSKDLRLLTNIPIGNGSRQSEVSKAKRRVKKAIKQASLPPITAMPLAICDGPGIIVRIPWGHIDLSVLHAHTSRNKSFAKVEATKKLREAVYLACRMCKFEPLGRKKCQMVVHITPPDNIGRDAANMLQGTKAAVDGIVKAGVVDDDRCSIIRRVEVVANDPDPSAAGYVIQLSLIFV